MGYIWYSYFPYSYTYFPTIEDHVDPLNSEFFNGMIQEIQNIEDTLGINVNSGFSNVADRISDLNFRLSTIELIDLDSFCTDSDLSTGLATITNPAGWKDFFLLENYGFIFKYGTLPQLTIKHDNVQVGSDSHSVPFVVWSKDVYLGQENTQSKIRVVDESGTIRIVGWNHANLKFEEIT